MEREDTNGNAEGEANGDTEDTATASERGTPEGFDSLEDSPSVASLEMERSETGRRTSIFKYYSYKNAGECPCGPRCADSGKPDSSICALNVALTARNHIALITRE